MEFLSKIGAVVQRILKEEFQLEVDSKSLLFNETRKEFDGDYTLVLFPFLKTTRKNPQELGKLIGDTVVQEIEFVQSYNIIKGFLNFEFHVSFWLDILKQLDDNGSFSLPNNGNKVLVEFSSPNTNKPLHLGHVRNILLGWACSNILSAAGYEVVKTQIINDRGIAICKSMLAWQKFGAGATPQSEAMKADHFVGHYYVLFEKKFKEEYSNWQSSEEGGTVYQNLRKEDQSEEAFFKSYKNKYFNDYSALGAEAKSMLLKWEQNDVDVRALWSKMNNWVYQGFEETYKNLGVTFDSIYYESDTYTLGKDIIQEGLSNGVFYKKEDGSVWIDLEDVGMDHKLVLRSDGTSVYMTQDIGTARKRYEDTQANGMVYTVADEQDYHFKALFETLKKLEEPYCEGLHHLSYGMVDLPTGKMKSREGTVVDADDLLKEVIQEAKNNAVERGEIESISEDERQKIYQLIGKAALNFFILKVNPKKRMVFNPAESVDMQGTTGPYVQNAYVRIQSIKRKAGEMDLSKRMEYSDPEPIELDIIKKLNGFLSTLQIAADQYDPSIMASYCYELAKLYHKFYSDIRILGATEESAKAFRIALGNSVARTLQEGFRLIGIEMPNRM